MNDTLSTVAEKPKLTKAILKEKLAQDARWATRGLLAIYKYQTSYEQASEVTAEHNDVGFTGADGTILTSFAKFYTKFNRLSDKQMAILFKKMPKYAGQLLRICDKKQ